MNTLYILKKLDFLNFNLTHLTIKHSVYEQEKNSIAKSPDQLTHPVFG
jgi:hypothetical protein